MPLPYGEQDLLLRDDGVTVPALILRPLIRSDVPAIEALCAASFPIQYPECWLVFAVSGVLFLLLVVPICSSAGSRQTLVVPDPLVEATCVAPEAMYRRSLVVVRDKFEEVVAGELISVGLFDDKQLVAMMVAETKTILHCNPEDRDIIADTGAHVVYMLSLAVAHAYRRLGLASRLLRHLLDSVVDHSPFPKAVFLHVLSTNAPAIKFYKAHGFVHHTTLLNYYHLKSEYGDACTYVLYTNGSRPPFSIGDVCRSLGTAICFPLKALCRTFFH
ncbi:unnamed protein product [Nippostrongylus brasiliensis]|uniref:N-alpha-acetyltransferase 60 n=1 Tax=Nippostrongylus brasiliensis TaxID=27835 RepID=A0A0N4XYS1_NIPBR|nr:unnamed protein product [Nippostrongylus brasiliensis]